MKKIIALLLCIAQIVLPSANAAESVSSPLSPSQPVVSLTNQKPQASSQNIPSGSILPIGSPLQALPPVPEGWTRAASNENFAFERRRDANSAHTLNLKLRDLRTGQIQTLASASIKTYGDGIFKVHDVSPDGTHVVFSNVSGNAQIQKINNAAVRITVPIEYGLKKIGWSTLPNGDPSVELYSSLRYTVNLRTFQTVDNYLFGYGAAGDTFLTADYNHDGKQDLIAFRDGRWHVDTNGDKIADVSFQYGGPGATPLAADFNHDGKIDIGIFRDGHWHIDTNGDRIADIRTVYGGAGATPLAGDFNGDGKIDMAIFRDGQWHIDTNGDRIADRKISFGRAGDIPLVGDFNRDGVADLMLYRPNNGVLSSFNGLWFVDQNRDGKADIQFYHYAVEPRDTPLFGDANRDGIPDIVSIRNGVWTLNKLIFSAL